MKKILIFSLFVILTAIIAYAINYDDYNIYTKNKIIANNILFSEFNDDLGIIQRLIDADAMKRNTNQFNGEFIFSWNKDDTITQKANKVLFKGITTFGKFDEIQYGKIDYVIDGFKLADDDGTTIALNINPWVTQAFGTANLTYTYTITIKETVPIFVEYNYWHNRDGSFGGDIDDYVQEIIGHSEEPYVSIHASSNDKFQVNTKCYEIEEGTC